MSTLWRPWRPEIAALDEGVLGEPPSWSHGVLIRLAPDVDLFDTNVDAESIEAVTAVMRATPQHAYLVVTTRAKRLLQLGNEGLTFPPNLWLGVGVQTDEDVWRVEDLLRCNTGRAWVSVDPLGGRMSTLPVAMCSWVVCRRGGGQPDWVRDLRDRCVDAGVPFALVGETIDGEIWEQWPDDLLAFRSHPRHVD